MHCNIGRGLSLQDQITVRLPAELSQALRRASRRLRRKNSDVVRMALEAFLGAGDRRGARPADRVRGLIGSLTSGVPDLAERHREYIIEALRRGR
jgi:Arc/MetJ-type ribon-helix-helix transcriptional regulator